MKLFTTVAVSLLGFGKHTVAQGFMGNCTWRGANLTGTFLGSRFTQTHHLLLPSSSFTFNQ